MSHYPNPWPPETVVRVIAKDSGWYGATGVVRFYHDDMDSYGIGGLFAGGAIGFFSNELESVNDEVLEDQA